MNCTGCGWCCFRVRCVIRSERWPGYRLPSKCPGLVEIGRRYWCKPLLDETNANRSHLAALADLGGGCRREVQKNIFRIQD